jgi:hypothetical protein
MASQSIAPKLISPQAKIASVLLSRTRSVSLSEMTRWRRFPSQLLMSRAMHSPL